MMREEEKSYPVTVERIMGLLEEHNMSGKQYLERMGLNRSAMTDWKNGKAKPTAATIVRTAELFRVTTDYLMGLQDLPNPVTKETMAPIYFKLANDAQKMQLTQRDIEFILSVAKTYKSMNAKGPKD